MLRRLYSPISSYRLLSTSSVHLHRVVIIGAAGGIGQALSMLIKADKLVTGVTLYDLKQTSGIGADISHVDTNSDVKSFTGQDKLADALQCSDIVLVTAGSTRGDKATTRDDLFEANATIILDVCNGMAKICPKASLVIVTNPINSLVPLAAKILDSHKVYDPRKLFGITKLDTIRSCTFMAEFLGMDPRKVKVPVIGGHSKETIVPLISQSEPPISGDKVPNVYKRVIEGGDAVVKAKDNKGSAQLAIAYATATFCNSLMKGLNGTPGVTDVAYVQCSRTELPFFSLEFELGIDGVKKFSKLPDMDAYEKVLYAQCLKHLRIDIEKGKKFNVKK